MNFSYVLNDQGNPVPIVENLISSRVKMQDNVQTTSNGAYADIDGCGLIVLQVTGEFVATIIPQVFDSSDVSGSSRNVEAIDVSNGNVVDRITKVGIYEIRNTIGMKMRARVNSYTSGSVTVNATVINTSAEPIQPVTFKKHHELIASIRNRSVAANGESWIVVSKDVSKYTFLYAHVLTDTTHEHTIYYKYDPEEAISISRNSPVPIEIIKTASLRDCSEWIELRGGTVINIALTNRDAESSHVYDVDIFGVM